VLTAVQVVYGVVEVRPAGREVVTLRAGGSWPRTKLAAADGAKTGTETGTETETETETGTETGTETETETETETGTTKADPVPVVSHHSHHAKATAAASTTPAPAAAPAPAPAPAAVSAPAAVPAPVTTTKAAAKAASPGEADFRAGWDAMKRGDHAAAAASFAASRTATGSTLVEDPTFWEGVALAKAGEATKAITALRRFVSTYKKSARLGEASARLGWLLVDAGDEDGAAAMFHAAQNDRVASVRASAKKGLARLGR